MPLDKSRWGARLLELDRLLAAERPVKRRGPRPGQRCDGSKKRAKLDRLAAQMRARGGKSWLESDGCSRHARRAAEARWRDKGIAWLCHGRVFQTYRQARVEAHGRPKRIELAARQDGVRRGA